MGTDVKKITEFIDNYLETHQMEYITPTKANELLAEAGLLDDSESRPGKPLRDLLRDNKFPHAYQEGTLWRIPKSNNLLVQGNQKKLPIRDNKEHVISEKKKKTKSKNEKERDELYVIRLCNEVLGVEASRQHTIDFLKLGLEAWCGETPYVLILGTFPSEKSLTAQAYYQNKSHNSFYRIMESLFERQSGMSDKDFIINNHIALWDCMKEADREGSLDANIKGYVANDVEKFLSQHPTITTIVLNGIGDTTKTFEKNFSVEELKHKYSILSLPSTSNSNSISFDEKLNSWRIIKEIVEAKS